MRSFRTVLSAVWTVAAVAATCPAAETQKPGGQSAAAPVVAFTQLPKPLQLYPRDLKSNRATVTVAGAVKTAGYDAIVVSVTTEGAVKPAKPVLLRQRLRYKDGAAPFVLSTTIPAELKNRAFSVSLRKGAREQAVTNVTGVVAGDVFLINGQSNAEARSFRGSANTNQSPFLRTFGNHVHNRSVSADLAWHPAEGDREAGPGAIGQWGMRLGRLLVESEHIPVAFLNGALGGQAIQHFTRDANNPTNLDTNYGRLLFRSRQAGVTNAVRAMLWYQGESDNGNADVHETGFLALVEGWKKDYAPISRIYVMQLRVGCGVDKMNVELRNRQRLWPRKFADMSVLSPYGINPHDGCHYSYEGYAEIGNRFFALLSRDLYGRKADKGIDAPDVESAFFSKPDQSEITLVTRDPADVLRFDAGAQADFALEGEAVPITGGKASGNRIVLSLASGAPRATAVTYTGHAGPGPWVTNARGIGLLVGKFPLASPAAP